MTRSKALARPGERRVVSNVVKGSIGNLIEWYDWYTYAAFSVYFAATFFPQGDATAQLLNTASVFAVGFLMRPIGGWLLGRFADRFGRLVDCVWVDEGDFTQLATGHRLRARPRGRGGRHLTGLRGANASVARRGR